MARPDVADVLMAVNELRAAYNIGRPLKELPRGFRRLPTCCPLGRALRAAVVPWNSNVPPYWQPERSQTRPLPDVLAAFGRAFDEGEYPELIEGTA